MEQNHKYCKYNEIIDIKQFVQMLFCVSFKFSKCKVQYEFSKGWWDNKETPPCVGRNIQMTSNMIARIALITVAIWI